jgi:hypothetical protein
MEIDIDKLIEVGLSPDEYIFLKYIYLNKSNNNLKLRINVNYLIENKIIKIIKDDIYELTKDGVDLLNKIEDIQIQSEESVASWIDEWRNLFPDKIKSGGGYLIKGDKQGCLKKMEKFVKHYKKEFNKDIIFEATKKYVDGFKKKNDFRYMKSAHYFIKKEDVSELASYCEEIVKEKQNLNNGIEIDVNNDINKTQRGGKEF